MEGTYGASDDVMVEQSDGQRKTVRKDTGSGTNVETNGQRVSE